MQSGRPANYMHLQHAPRTCYWNAGIGTLFVKLFPYQFRIYAKTTFLYQIHIILCEIHVCTCINCNGDISSHAWLKIVNQNGQCHGRNVLLHLYFVRCAHAHIYNQFCAQGLPQGSSLKNKSVFGGSFIRVELVKED